jgi:hypothetical protein
MNLNHKYEMVNLIVEPEIMRLVSREIATNKPVVVHLMLRGYTEENKQLLKKLSRAGPELRRYVLETGEYENVPCVVTEYFPESLCEWLAKIADEGAPRNDNATANHDDDFTLIFEQPGALEASPTPSQAELRKHGDFTMLFQNSAPANAPESIEAVPDATGDFTKLFKVPSASRRQNVPEPAEKAEKAVDREGARASKLPGDFTALFKSAGLPQSPAKPPTLPASEPPRKSAVQPAPRDGPRKSSDLSAAFGRDLGAVRSSEPEKKPSPLAVVDSWHGMDLRGEERVPPPVVTPPVRIPSVSTTPVADPRPPIVLPAEIRGGGRRSYLPLIVVLSCLLAVAILVVLFFVMQGR